MPQILPVLHVLEPSPTPTIFLALELVSFFGDFPGQPLPYFSLPLSLSFLVPSLTLDAIFFFSPDYVLLYFVPVLFLHLLILERSIPKEVPYLSEANTDVFIGAMI